MFAQTILVCVSGFSPKDSMMEKETKDYDVPQKALLDYPDVFADVINALLYGGEPVVKR